MRPYFLLIGSAGTVGFAAAGVAMTLAALWNIDGSLPRPERFAIAFGLFWSAFTMLSLWLVAVYVRERLWLGDAAIRQQGLIWYRHLPLADVQKLHWRAWPEWGSAVIRTPTVRAAIYFGNFSINDRHEVIAFLRESIAEEFQENWSRFESQAINGGRP
jgi:hypothetical protein